MKVVLLNPAIPTSAMNFGFAMDLVGCAFSHIPLPLATLAALTPAGVDVAIVDECVEPVDLDLAADIVAMTGIYSQRERLFELADAFRGRGRCVVIGGPIATDLEDACRAHADVIFQGEAEYTWPAFIREFQAGAHQPVYRQEGYVDMADSPVPRFDLLKADRYTAGCVQVTRGCPYRCEFCDVPTKQGRVPRSKSVPQVLAEVEQLVALGFDSVFFVDDMFIGNLPLAKELLKALAELIKRLPVPVYFYTQVTLNVARHEDLLELFYKAGFRRFFIGIETHDQAKLQAMGKSQNTELGIMEAIRRIQSYNITVWAGLIVGLDGDDADTTRRMVEFVQDSAISPTLIGLLQAMPGAPLYDRITAEGRLRPLADVVGSQAHGAVEMQSASNIEPRLPAAAQMEAYASLVEQIYAPRAYGARILESAARGRQAHAPLLPTINGKSLMVIWRTTRYFLGAEPEVRRMFLGVLGRTLARGGRALPEILYQLVIYKHLYTFYSRSAAEARKTA